jgi:acyl carrier protein
MDESAIRDAARQAVRDIVNIPVSDQEPLLSSGLLDSLSVVRLLTSVEAHLNVIIPPGSVQPDDFDTIDSMVEAISRVMRPR